HVLAEAREALEQVVPLPTQAGELALGGGDVLLHLGLAVGDDAFGLAAGVLADAFGLPPCSRQDLGDPVVGRTQSFLGAAVGLAGVPVGLAADLLSLFGDLFGLGDRLAVELRRLATSLVEVFRRRGAQLGRLPFGGGDDRLRLVLGRP